MGSTDHIKKKLDSLGLLLYRLILLTQNNLNQVFIQGAAFHSLSLGD